MLKTFLQQLGLTDKEAEAYLSLLEIGTNAVSVIAQKSKLTRTTVYSVLEALKKRRFVVSQEKNNILYYTAERPEVVCSLLDQELRELNIRRHTFQQLMPEFRALINQSQTVPKVRYFEGIEGIKQIYEDTLDLTNYRKHKLEKLVFSCAPDMTGELKKYFEGYLKRRAASKISARAIFPDTKESKQNIKEDKRLLRVSRLVPHDKFPFTCEMSIYGNKMSYMSLQQNSYHGVIIESEEIMSSQKSMFELAWIGAKTF
jgi:sugar-specific transcriptional regulator TrmB